MSKEINCDRGKKINKKEIKEEKVERMAAIKILKI